MSLSRHSSSECLGGSKTCSDSSSFRVPVKSSIGEISARTSAMPSSRNHWNESRWTAMRSGSSRTSERRENERRSRDATRGTAAPQTNVRRRARAEFRGISGASEGQTRPAESYLKGGSGCNRRQKADPEGAACLLGAMVRRGAATVKGCPPCLARSLRAWYAARERLLDVAWGAGFLVL